METTAIILLVWLLIMIIVSVITITIANKEKNNLQKLLWKNGITIHEKDIELSNLYKKIRNKDATIKTLNKAWNKSQKVYEEINKNMDLTKLTFENEIATLEEHIMILKSRLHSEQVDSNNKEYARDKWRKKFETMQNVVNSHWFWKELIKKYDKAWKVIILAYNKAQKWTKHK